MARILVTGGAGFIGSNIVEELLEKGHLVRVMDNLSTGKMSNLEGMGIENFELMRATITDMETVKKAVKDIEIIFHEAAMVSVPRSVEDPRSNNEANITGTLNLLAAARDAGVERVVYASSSSIYGDTGSGFNKESMPANPQSPYGLSKYAGERYCQLFHSLYGLKTISLRYFNVYGPRQDPGSEYAAVIPRFIAAMVKGQPFKIFGDGSQTRDFTFVKDVVKANMLCMEAKKGFGDFFNIACQKKTSLNELVKALNKITGKGAAPEYAERRPGDILHSAADITKAREALGYSPSYTLEQGLKETVQYFMEDSL